MLRSIRLRIALPYVILVLLVMGALGLYLSNFIRQTYIQNLQSRLSVEARLIGDDLTQTIASQGSLPSSTNLDTQARQWSNLTGARVTIIAPNGTVVGESNVDSTRMENHLNRPEIQQALASGQGSSIRYSQTLGYDMLYTAIALNQGGKLVGFVRVAVPLKQVQADTSQLQQVIGAATLSAILLAILLSFWVASRTTRPLRTLADSARSLARRKFDGTLIPASHDEVGELTEAINGMISQLHFQLQTSQSESSKLSAVLQNMTDGVIIVDEMGRIRLVNPAAERMFNLQGQNVLNRTLAEALRYHQLYELWEGCRQSGKPEFLSFELPQRQIYLHGVATPLGLSLPGSTLLLFQDLSRLRQLEKVRRDFISNISHELRTPLASLKALTETLEESAIDDPPTARRFLSRMNDEIDALSQMVAELLELSRIESGQVPLHLVPTQPVDILEKAADRLLLQAERSELDLQVKVSPDLPPILVDPPRIEQVIVNLLHNAIKFTPAGGKIELEASQQNDEVWFQVRDTGVGISSADLPRIFERFYKADRARSGGGTGLGLAIAKHLVEAHGGRIWAKSTEGQGSVFTISLPVNEKTQNSVEISP